MPGLAVAVMLELCRVDRATIAEERLKLGDEGRATCGTQSRRHQEISTLDSGLWALVLFTGSMTRDQRPKSRVALLLSHHAIDAPDARASRGHVEKREAEHRRTLAHVQDRERMLRKVRD